jgi:DNA/RNA-binding domain of Phe-tRNA-synthetase-like protein
LGRVILEQSFRELFPEATIGVVVVSGIDNRRSADRAQTSLRESAAAAAAALGDGDLPGHPAVAVWREAYRRFGVKPSDYRSGIEGLLRAARRGEVRSVNPLVDCYNAVSLRHLLPCGGEDLDALVGNLRLTRARGDEHFVPLGATEPAPPKPGEVVYADDAGIVCRAWNWREADRTKLTGETTRAVLVIEALPPRTADEVTVACAELAEVVTSHLGGKARVALLGANGVNETPLDA